MANVARRIRRAIYRFDRAYERAFHWLLILLLPIATLAILATYLLQLLNPHQGDQHGP